MTKVIVATLVILGLSPFVLKFLYTQQETSLSTSFMQDDSRAYDNPSSTPTPTPTLKPLSKQKILLNEYHIFQSFNNCGPASLSMALSYFGIKKSQEELGQEIRPYQIPGGDNDDKSVTLNELAEKSKEFGLIPYHRPNGNIEILKQFISYDIPIITRTWLHENEDIGHYRVVKGFNDESQELIQDDSYENKNLRFSYDKFSELWKKFNYEYLVLVPQEKKEIAEAILGENKDSKIAWQKAIELSQKELERNTGDIYARFNLSVAYFNIGNYQSSVSEFEKVESSLPFRTLWYQIEPIEGYYMLGNYDRVFEITDKVLNNSNRAFSELYILRGNVYKKQGKISEARSEFEKAIYYNRNLEEAKNALSSLN